MSYYPYDNYVDFKELEGKTLKEVNVGTDKITFLTEGGDSYTMAHIQDCCESVYVEDVVGDMQELIGSPILLAEEVANEDERPPEHDLPYEDSHTWTFYKLRTNSGDVTIRWYGSSNGYYSESVQFWKG